MKKSLNQVKGRIEIGKKQFKEKINNAWVKYCASYKLKGHQGMNEHISFVLECEKKMF